MNKYEFAERVMSMEKTLYHVSYTLLHNDHDCADAVQEAVTIAYAKLEQLKFAHYFQTWVIRILINECYNILRKRKRTTPLDADAFDCADKSATFTEQYEAIMLHDAIMSLPLEERMPIVLHYLEGFTVAEISRIVGSPEGTIKWRMSKARKKMRTYLGEEEVN